MKQRSLGLALAIALIGAVAGISTPAMAGFSEPFRYASPHGSGTACTTAQPCDIITAVNDAPMGNVVVIKPGTYGSATHPLTTQLSDAENGEISVMGLTDSPNPTIYDNAGTAIDFENVSNLSHINLITAAADFGVYDDGGGVANVSVVSSGSSSGACNVIDGKLTDSLCVTTGNGDPAVALEQQGTHQSTLTNVTAEATGPGGVGLLVEGSSLGDDLQVTATNSIIHGRETDVSSQAGLSAATSVTLAHSDYKTGVSGGVGSPSIHRDSTDIKTTPKFINAAHGNFQEKAGSPTIDTGAAVDGGDTDVIGTPRPLGAKPDMGAYEFLPPPTAKILKVAKLTKHGADLSVKVNPEGLATKVKLVASLGHHHVTSATISAGKLRTSTIVKLVLTGLKHHATYTVYAVARNKGGHLNSATKKVRTH